MSDHTITLTLEGLESEGGHVRLERFLKWLDLNNKTLASFDKLVAEGRRANYFQIVGLSHDSPATVRVEPRATDPTNDLRGALVEKYNGTIHQIASGSVPTGLGVNLLRNLRDLAHPVGRTVKSARITIDKNSVDLSEAFASTIDAALRRVEYGVGSIEGAVERFNSHEGANVFYVFPAFGPSKVACKFPDALLKKAAEAVTKNVRVYGSLIYLHDSNFPHEIEVESIDVYEPEDELPWLDDLRGIAPEATGDKSSEDFIAEERDAWED